MGLRTWSKSELEYGRKVWDNGLEGARLGGTEYFKTATSRAVSRAVGNAFKSAALGACIGMFSSCPGKRGLRKAMVRAVVGGAIGFGAGVTWELRRLAASVARGALGKMGKVRDQRWLERHPIDYA